MGHTIDRVADAELENVALGRAHGEDAVESEAIEGIRVGRADELDSVLAQVGGVDGAKVDDDVAALTQLERIGRAEARDNLDVARHGVNGRREAGEGVGSWVNAAQRP